MRRFASVDRTQRPIDLCNDDRGSDRLFALDTVPAKPGLARVPAGGAPIAIEVEPAPGLLCEPVDLDGAVDITDLGEGGPT